jgi:hypothetical protein
VAVARTLPRAVLLPLKKWARESASMTSWSRSRGRDRRPTPPLSPPRRIPAPVVNSERAAEALFAHPAHPPTTLTLLWRPIGAHRARRDRGVHQQPAYAGPGRGGVGGYRGPCPWNPPPSEVGPRVRGGRREALRVRGAGFFHWYRAAPHPTLPLADQDFKPGFQLGFIRCSLPLILLSYLRLAHLSTPRPTSSPVSPPPSLTSSRFYIWFARGLHLAFNWRHLPQ